MLLNLLAKSIISSPPYKRFDITEPQLNFFWNTFLHLDKWTFSRFEHFEPKIMEKIQKQKLRDILRHAQKNTDYWKDLIPRNFISDPVETLKTLPVLTREMLKKNSPSVFVAKSIAVWRQELIRTSGTTTNSPVIFYGDKINFLRMESVIQHILKLDFGDRLLRFNLPFPLFNPSSKYFGINFALYGNKNAAKKILSKLLELNITHLLGPTSNILRLAAIFRTQSISYPLKTIGVVGEHLLKKDRIFMQNIFRCPIYNIYASKEASGPLAYECDESNGWHMNMANFYWEILDDDNNEVETGKDGNIILTMLESELMPFIRYKIGDRGRILSDSCPCGRKNPRLLFTGRDVQFITLRSGHLLPLLSLVQLIRSSGPLIDQFQFKQQKIGEIRVMLVPLQPISNEALEKILSTAYARYNKELDVHIDVVNKIPGKSVLFVKNIT